MSVSLEIRLESLVEANSDKNRNGWAQNWKKKGRPVAGVLDEYVPVEILYAAGFLPWRVTGSWEEGTPLSFAHRPAWSNPRNMRILEDALRGDLDFVDAVVASDWDIDLKRLWDDWTCLRKPGFAHIMYVPRVASKIHYDKMRESNAILLSELEVATGKKVSQKDLKDAVRVYQHLRELIGKMYELRKRDVPAVSGSEALGITTAGLVMPPEEFNAELDALLPYLDKRKSPLKQHKPRLLMSSDFLDDIRYIELIESLGSVVVMDDFDTGSRFFWPGKGEPADDPLTALAKDYLDRPHCPRMHTWPEQITQIIAWVREFRADAVVELRLNNEMIRHLRTPVMKKRLEAEGIPSLLISRDHQFAAEGQLRTRVGAFLELLETAGVGR